jgi:hypothetical protein
LMLYPYVRSHEFEYSREKRETVISPLRENV